MARVANVTKALRPKSGFSHYLHIVFTALIPVLTYMFVQWGLTPWALAVILLSKWRMLAVQPRHWWPNIRANAIDITVGVSTLVFMMETASNGVQAILALLYALWLLLLKPRSDMLAVSMQAFIGQVIGTMAIFLALGDGSTGILVVATGLLCYLSALHFFTSFDEPHTPLYAHAWGYFGAALTWLLSHWLLFYSVIAQPALLITVIGFGLAGLYYLEQADRLSVFWRRQMVFFMIAIVVVVLAFSEWGDKAI